jgi:hypothetical protein
VINVDSSSTCVNGFCRYQTLTRSRTVTLVTSPTMLGARAETVDMSDALEAMEELLMAPEVSERVCDGMAVVAAEVGEVSGAQFLSLVTEEGVKTAVAARLRQRLRITAPVPPPRGSRSDATSSMATVSPADVDVAVGPSAAVSVGVAGIDCCPCRMFWQAALKSSHVCAMSKDDVVISGRDWCVEQAAASVSSGGEVTIASSVSHEPRCVLCRRVVSFRCLPQHVRDCAGVCSCGVDRRWCRRRR